VVFQVSNLATSKTDTLRSYVMGLDKDLNLTNRSSSEEPIETQPRLRRSKIVGATILKGVVPDISNEELGALTGHVEPAVPVDFQARQKRGVVSFTKSDQEQTNDREKKPKSTLPSRKLETLRYACPFYRHAPEIHKARKACHAYPGFGSVHRVK
jgi:hypothetical protein